MSKGTGFYKFFRCIGRNSAASLSVCKEFCLATKDADMSFGRNQFLHLLEKRKNLIINNSFFVEDIFVTRDVRKGRENEQWINVLAKKNHFY